MDDGSRNGNTVLLHTESFTKADNLILSKELNTKFGLNTQVISHKGYYSIIKIPYTDSAHLVQLVKPYILESMMYKLPKS